MSASPTQTGPRSPAPDTDAPARPPLTVEGWYALHQAFCIEKKALRALGGGERRTMLDAASAALEEIAQPDGGGWSAIVRLVGSRDDVLLMHFRPTLEAIRDAGHALWRIDPACILRQTFAFLSVTEVGLYHLADGGGDATPDDAVIRAERDVPHTRQRLYPSLPPRMPWVSFYPTSKRRDQGQNWYALPLAERSALMRSHGMTGRRHTAHIRQIITRSGRGCKQSSILGPIYRRIASPTSLVSIEPKLSEATTPLILHQNEYRNQIGFVSSLQRTPLALAGTVLAPR